MRALASICLGLCFVLSVIGASAWGQQAAQRPQFESSVDVMRIQVAVGNDDDEFVPGLELEDFVLLVDGQPRTIVDLLEVSDRTRALRATQPPVEMGMHGDRLVASVVKNRGLPPAARRHFLFFLDLSRLPRRGLRYARSASLDFLESGVMQDDLVGLATYSPRRGLEFAVPFSADHAPTRDYLETLRSSRAMEALEAAGAGIDFHAIAENDEQTADFIREIEELRSELSAERALESLRELADAMAVVEGRKHVLFFSRGWPDGYFQEAGFRTGIDAVASGARRTDTVIHTFYPGVLPAPSLHLDRVEGRPTSRAGGPLSGIERTLRDRQSLHFLAEETGGLSTFYRHNTRKGLEKVERLTRSYYVLTFPLRDEDPQRVDIQVQMRRPEVDILWAPNQLALPGTFDNLTAVQRQFDVAEALDLGSDRSDIRLDLLTMPLSVRDGFGRMAVVAEIPPREVARLLDTSGGEALDVELLGLAIGPSSDIADYFRTRANLPVDAERVIRSGTPFRYYNLIAVPPGGYYVKFMVRETTLGEITTRTVRFDVPEAPELALRLAGPVLVATDTEMLRGIDSEVLPAHRQGRPFEYAFSVAGNELIPTLANEARAGQQLDLFAALYDEARDPVTGQPQVDVEVELHAGDGRVLPINQSVITASDRAPDGALRLLVRLRVPPSAATGSWQLVLRATDEVAAVSVEQSLQLTILGSDP